VDDVTVPAYRDPLLAVEDRVEDLIGRMDIDEKLSQLGAVEFPRLISSEGLDPARALAVVPHGIGQVTRIGATTGLEPAQSAELFNMIQHTIVDGTRLGVPVMVHEESVAGYCARGATVFPQALALGCSWDPGLIAEVADRVRRQLLAVGARHALAPVLDVARDPRWGRVEETYGEDAVLAGTLGTAYVRALQTDDLTRGVLATGKHFIGYALSEGGRNHGPVQLGPRELREVYAEPFAAAIRDAGLATIMSSYNCVDALPASGSYDLLTGLLRDELGFDGMVVADYFAVALLVSYHRVAASREEAAVRAVTAGLDVELPKLDCFLKPLKSAVTAGRVPMAKIDTALRRVLRAKVKLGLFESPYVDLASVRVAFEDPANTSLARQAAIRGIVMVANKGVLPLPDDLSRVAVVGPAADDRRLLQGDYHYPAHQELMFELEASSADGASSTVEGVTEGVAGPRSSIAADDLDTVWLPSGPGRFKPGEYYTDHVTPLAGLRAALSPLVEVVHQKGCELGPPEHCDRG
jgi:beta-glucosidase-like glycosyl hydrolase